MPSPFPGMDPYLERPPYFSDLHDQFIANLSAALQGRLPDPYFATISQRVWVEVSARSIGPDVEIVRRREPERGASGGVALLEAPRSRPVIVTVPHDEFRETFVEIRVRQGDDGGERIVTAIEVLSPGNKTPWEHGRDLYLKKQRELLESRTHLIEIDLLRGGAHATAVPLGLLLEAAGAFDYHVSIHRFDDFLVYPIRLEERLPEIVVPLLPGDPDVPIDLQAVFDRAYDAGPYRRRVRYAEADPILPLRPDRVEWAAEILKPAATNPKAPNPGGPR